MFVRIYIRGIFVPIGSTGFAYIYLLEIKKIKECALCNIGKYSVPFVPWIFWVYILLHDFLCGGFKHI